jgi:hypothetical protein
MNKLIKTRMLFVLGALLWVASSCQKDNSLLTNGTPNTGAADLKQVALAEQLFNNLCDQIEAFHPGSATNRISGQNGLANIVGACGTIIIDTISMPRTITIDYGNVNCKGADGHWYRGKIINTFTGSYRTQGTVSTYVTQNFFLDNNKIDVNRTITNLGYNGEVKENFMHFSVSEYIKITMPFGLGSITQQSEIDREWVEGESTESSNDDVYMLRGSKNILFSNGTQFESATVQALRKHNSFPFYVTGTEKVTRSDYPSLDFVLDYGYPEGAQDDLALATYRNGSTEVIQLK